MSSGKEGARPLIETLGDISSCDRTRSTSSIFFQQLPLPACLSALRTVPGGYGLMNPAGSLWSKFPSRVPSCSARSESNGSSSYCEYYSKESTNACCGSVSSSWFLSLSSMSSVMHASSLLYWNHDPASASTCGGSRPLRWEP